MISIDINGIDDVKKALEDAPKKARRACAIALNQTARAIWLESKEEMKRVFDSPAPYTLRSPAYDKATTSNLEAKVYYVEPERMKDHYLVPQVEGGSRKLKGFERGIGLGQLVPTRVGAQMDQRGNMSVGQIKQIVSVLGKAETSSGYMANITERSAKRNTKQRDYVIIKSGNRAGLIPGVYQRFAQIGKGIDAKTSRRFGIRGARAYQYGRSKGKWKSFTRARGLRPVLLVGRTGQQVKPLFDFYGMANKVYDKEFMQRFWVHFNG